ncbi:MAG: hypothetical protein E6K81_13995 [Candidatus Eisenbacteria bacterium]|uniref:Uncharacterized protein n=1 Tax=Eiseniibacteriota bacterium TaxID=2212470 RepID=A0A538U1P4_UNCEI|nr:MAG: hypothetical protein E6K81_13995 [Candidatus Eisenbacteria bacterium]
MPLLAHAWGAPLGEPVSDDFDFLHRALRLSRGSAFDGFGSLLYWRPLSRQVYFSLMAPLILGAPAMVAALHTILLAAAAGFLYRALRVRWTGPLAALAASFPLFAESTRVLLGWPSAFQDLGALLFATLAIHEAAHRRLPSTLAALVAALLCKEVAVLAALLLPWVPDARASSLGVGATGDGPRTSALSAPRSTHLWSGAVAATVTTWALVYLLVARQHGGIRFGHELVADPASRDSGIPLRLMWALTNAARSAFSLPAEPARGDLALWMALAILLTVAALRFALGKDARQRLREAWPWVLWGSAWFLAAAAPLFEAYPGWWPYRSVLASLGLGVALTAFLGSAHPWLVGGLLVLRLVSFAASPGPPATMTVSPPTHGSSMDFERLARLQRVTRGIHRLLATHYPRLPANAAVVQRGLPLMTEYGLGGNEAVQVWYRDRTLHWMRFEEFRRHPETPVVTVVEFQPYRDRQFALVAPDAMRALLRGVDAIAGAQWTEALAQLGRADSLQGDRQARVFLGTVVSKRALALTSLGEKTAAEREAREALVIWPENFDSHFVLAQLRFEAGRLAEAEAQLDSLLSQDPGDRGALELRERVRAARSGALR